MYTKNRRQSLFLKRFLHFLYEKELIWFERDHNVWKWDLDTIQKLNVTDNIVVFMVEKISMLSTRTQLLLKLAACIGNKFDLEVLSMVDENLAEKTADELWQALREGLILPLGGHTRLKFAHDRIQQAAYSMIDKIEKKEIHLKIGRILLERHGKNEHDENIFQIVDQMNIGFDLILKPSEREELAKLNLSAGKKAILSIAYASALQYIRMAAELLGDECWKINYTLTFDIYVQRAGLEQLNGNFAKAEEIIKRIRRNVDNVNDKTIAYSLLIKQFTIQQRYGESLEIAKEALALLDVKLPESNYDTAWEDEYKKIISLLLKGERTSFPLMPCLDASSGSIITETV
jgi:predicted ATPase